jgi:hypothetical protein
MKEILQLFRRDAEHAPPSPGATSYTGHIQPKILHGGSSGVNSGQSSREASVIYQGERRATPPVLAKKEDNVYGRRW